MPVAQTSVLTLQIMQVAFLLLHDWVPLGRFSDIYALRRIEPLRKIVLATATSSVPFVLGLMFSLRHVHDPRWPHWVRNYIWISYGLLFVGELQAWWVPYLGNPQPERAVRYQQLFGRTRAFLPERNGIVPNTLHVLLHTCTVLTLLVMFWV